MLVLLYSDIGDSNSDLIALEQARKLVDLDPKDEKFQVRLLVCLEKKGDKSLLKSILMMQDQISHHLRI